MKFLKTLYSNEDWSVNFITDNNVEARYVRRDKDYFIAYLSSHNGCNKACRFCHLTQSKQTDFYHVTIEEYLQQAKEVLEYYDNVAKVTQGPAERINFNFMSRGEPFANDNFRANAKELLEGLEKLAKSYGLKSVSFNISSILPKELDEKSILEILEGTQHLDVKVYYSLYSLDEDFRKRWIPKSMNPELAFRQLKEWEESGGTTALHWAYIKDVNDSEEQLKAILNKVKEYELKPKFNLVRYNPYSQDQGTESDDEVLEANFEKIKKALKHPHSRMVPRVGFDVKASCGMFVSSNE